MSQPTSSPVSPALKRILLIYLKIDTANHFENEKYTYY